MMDLSASFSGLSALGNVTNRLAMWLKRNTAMEEVGFAK